MTRQSQPEFQSRGQQIRAICLRLSPFPYSLFRAVTIDTSGAVQVAPVFMGSPGHFAWWLQLPPKRGCAGAGLRSCRGDWLARNESANRRLEMDLTRAALSTSGRTKSNFQSVLRQLDAVQTRASGPSSLHGVRRTKSAPVTRTLERVLQIGAAEIIHAAVGHPDITLFRVHTARSVG